MDRRVYLAECRDYSAASVKEAVGQVLDGFGGTGGIFRDLTHKKVFIKVNLLSAVPPERAVTTHPAVVEALAQILIDAGAEVTIGDSGTTSAGEQALRRLYRVTGMEEVAQRTGAQLALSVSPRRAEYPAGKVCRSFNIISPVLDADFVISAAKLKTHGLAYYTGAVKNLFGCIPGLEKAGTHASHPDKRRFNRLLCDLCGLVAPAFSIVDGVVGMEGAGPLNGNPKEVGVIGGAVNPYALDLAMCECVSFSPRSIPVLSFAADDRLVPRSAQELDLLGGCETSRFKTEFVPATGGKSVGLAALALGKLAPHRLREAIRERRSPWPLFGDGCVGCGHCAEICPRRTISLSGGKAHPDYTACIRCYCCQEICPAGAITLVRRRPGENV